MPTSKAYSGQGLVVQIGTFDAVTTPAASDVFLSIGEINDCDPPSPSADTIEVTHLTSDIKEFIAGLLDGGEATLTCNFINDDPGQLECREAMTLRQRRNVRFIFPTTMIPNRLTAQAIVTSMPVKTASNDKAMLTIALKITSVYVWDDV